MEINKVSSNSVTNTNSTKSQKLVCDEGGCYLVDIDEQDSEVTLDESVKKDEEKTSSSPKNKKSSNKVTELTSKNFKSEVRNKEGTTFVIVGGSRCGRCSVFDSVLKKVNNTLGDSANFVHFNYDENSGIFSQLKKETGVKQDSFGYPIIIKCVNGKATELYDYSDIRKIYDNENKMLNWFENKIEKDTEKNITEDSKDDACVDGSCEVSVQKDDSCADGSCELTSNEESSTKSNKYIKKALNLDSESLANAQQTVISMIQSANSIGELKNLLTKLDVLDINTQLNVMDAIAEIKFDDDLSTAKSKVLAELY